MAETEIADLSASDLARLIASGEVGATEAVEAALARIEAVDPSLRAFAVVLPEAARAAAAEVDRRRARGEALGALGGVPVALKDYTPTAGIQTTAGSRAFATHVPQKDAVIAERLKAAGAVLVGKTTTPEFAGSWFTRNALHGVTRNPWDPSRSAGGSSGGSAVAVATGCVPLAEGCDMAGSVRAPAAFCGVVGLKPALGRIPFDALPTTFDEISHFGPLSRTVEDAALFLEATAGAHPVDMFSFAPPPLALERPIRPARKGVRLALDLDLGAYVVDPAVAESVRAACAALEEAGAVVEAVSVGFRADDVDAFWRATFVWMAALYGEVYDRAPDALEPFTRRLVEIGRAVDGPTLKRTDFARARMWHALSAVLSDYDALLCPTMAVTAPPADADDFDWGHRDADGRRIVTLDMTAPFNLLSVVPAISVPAGLAADGLPVGLQIVGRPFDEATVLSIARSLEAARPFPLPRA